jgi:preprotein translocase subunit YajC
MKIAKNLIALSSALIASSYAVAQEAATTGPQQVAGSAAQPQAGGPAWINFALIGGIILFMWLFVFRPQSKRAKEQKEFLSSLAPGVEVITSGGVIGTVVEVQDSIVSLNVGNSTIRVLKSSISGKLGSPAVVVETTK